MTVSSTIGLHAAIDFLKMVMIRLRLYDIFQSHEWLSSTAMQLQYQRA